MPESNLQPGKLVKLGLMIFIELVAAFLVLEACLIALDSPAIEAFPAPFVKKLRYPNQEHVFRDEDYSRYHINSSGLVGPEKTLNPNSYRIAVFGDSFVESFQVPHEFKFTTLIEKQFRPSMARGAVEVWNFGFAGDNTGNEYARWVHQAGNTHFDLVIFTFNDRDLLENRPQDIKGPSGAFLIEQADHGFLLDYSRIHGNIGAFDKWAKSAFGEFFYATHSVRLRVEEGISSRLLSWRTRFNQVRETVSPGVALNQNSGSAGEAVSDEMLTSTVRQLSFVQKQIGGSGTPVLLVGLPTAEIMPGSVATGANERRASYVALSRALDRSGAHFLDTFPVLSTAVNQGRDPYGDWEPGGHLNRLGHRMVAQAILEALQRGSLHMGHANKDANAVQ